MNERNCRSCDVPLSPGVNCAPSSIRISDYICTKCKSARTRLSTDYDKKRAYEKKYRLTNKNKINKKKRESRRKRIWGLSETDHKLFIANGCAICGSHDKPCVDHNHLTGKIRGCLCMKCNTAIGKLGDSIEMLQKAIRYLEENDK